MSRSKRIGVLDLSKEVSAMFATYGQDVNEVIDDAMMATAKEAEQELKAVSRFSENGNPTGVYSADWTFGVQPVKRYSRQIVVYNADHYRLTHLLEFGHALKRGGRKYGQVQGYEHIKPVNDKAQENFINEVVERITELNS